MVLEASIVCIDNSEWSRNADYTPTRLDTQSEACNLVCGVKTSQHPESAVGLVAMAGDRVNVLLSPTADLGKLISSLPKLEVEGAVDFVRGVQTAQMALKHRQNKNQRQRIIAFVCSPINATVKQLETLGRGLKKNNVSLDIVSLGEITDNHDKLSKLMETMGNAENCHFLEHAPGERLLADVLLSSPICMGEAAAGGGGAPANSNFEFGIDPSTDPELAMALRISMEEERARQAKREDGPAKTEEASAAAASTEAPAAAAVPMEGVDDLDEDVRMALLLSLQDDDTKKQPSAAAATPQPNLQIDDLEGLDDEVRQALMLSLQENEGESNPASKKAKGNSGGAVASQPSDSETLFQNRQFVEGLLESLPGVDMNDPRIKEALDNCKDKDKDEKDKDKDEKDDK